jgi:hypothetical protein
MTSMSGVLKKLLLPVAIVAFLFFVATVTSVIFYSDDSQESQIRVTTKLNDVSRSEIEDIKTQVRKALISIPPILGIEYDKTTKIQIVDYGICNTIGDVIFVPIFHVRDRSAAIIHEVTHIIAKHENNSFFSEGLAVYFQERFGDFNVFPNYSVPLDDLVRNYKSQLMSFAKLKSNKMIFGQIGTERRRIAYIEAGSFINFLIEKYGEKKLADLHNSKSLNYKEVYGKEIEKLEIEWKVYVFGKPSKKI